MVHFKKNETICKICVPPSDKTTHRTFMVCLWISAASVEYCIAALFAKREAIFAKRDVIFAKRDTIRRNVHFHGKKCCIKVQCTRRDKCGTRYTTLISAVVACLLNLF